MPAVDEFPRPSDLPPFHDTNDGWAVPLGTISGLRLYLSYGVFVAAAVLVGALLVFRNQVGNGDLPAVALVGLAFWLVGWLVQVTVYGFYRFAFGVPIETLTIGILGVESRPRDWDARTALVVTVTSLLTLVVTGGLIVVAEQFVNGTQPWPRMLNIFHAPSFGLGQADSIWLGGAWLCWIQAICQLFPLPRSTGRMVVVAGVSLLVQRLGEGFQTHFSRRCIQLIAFTTSLFVLAAIARSPSNVSANWLFVFALSVLLWVSARASDIRLIVISFGAFPYWENADSQNELSFERIPAQRTSLWQTIKESIASISHRRRLRQAIRTEHQEAIDSSRLDEVLQQLHQHGRDSLSPDDLKLLQRMSDNLKKERQSS